MNWQITIQNGNAYERFRENIKSLLQDLKIGDNWWTTAFVWSLVLIAVVSLFKYRAQIRLFIAEVRAELAKASWPWDPKEKGFKKYKELVDSTMVVIVAMLLLSGYIGLLDLVLVHVVGFITGGVR